MTKIKDYPEKRIRNAIKNKLKPKINSGKRSKHDKGYIFLDGKEVGKVKLPNDHSRVMKHSKSQHIADALKLDCNEFNDLIDCPMTGTKYYELLKNKIS